MSLAWLKLNVSSEGVTERAVLKVHKIHKSRSQSQHDDENGFDIRFEYNGMNLLHVMSARLMQSGYLSLSTRRCSAVRDVPPQ